MYFHDFFYTDNIRDKKGTFYFDSISHENHRDNTHRVREPQARA